MSGVLQKSCCCTTPSNCEFGNVSWSCGSSRVRWSTIHSWSFDGQFSATTTQNIGPFGNSRPKERYKTGFVKTSLGGGDFTPYYTTTQVGDYLSDATGNFWHSQVFSPTTISSFDATDFPNNAQIVGEWESNFWEAYGSGNTCGCSGLGHLCCDREIVTTYTLTANIDTSQISTWASSPLGKIRFTKEYTTFDPTDFASGTGDRTGCLSIFASDGWGFPTRVLIEKRVRTYEEGDLVSDVTTTHIDSTKTLAMTHANVRWGVMDECDDWSTLEPESWLNELSSWPNGFSYLFQTTGTSQRMTHWGIFCWVMQEMVGYLNGFGGTWDQILNEIGTTSSTPIDISYQPYACGPPIRGNNFAPGDGNTMVHSQTVVGNYGQWRDVDLRVSYHQAHEHFGPSLYP